MSRPNDRDQPIEVRLDALLDQLGSGVGEPGVADGDPELRDLALLARALRDDDDVAWPDDGYPLRLTDNLYTELGNQRSTLNLNGTVHDDRRTFGEHPEETPRPVAIPGTSLDELAGMPRRKMDIRRIAQIAAVAAGFALVTLVIAAVFRGYGNDEPDSAGGFLAGNVASHPPQIAVAMLPDPLDADPDIYVISPDGAIQTNLTDHLAADSMPAWSPDGRRLAFVSNRSGPEAVYILDLESGDLRELYAPELEDNLHLRNLAWSPDSESIALMRFSKSSVIGGPLSALVVVDVASGEAYPVEIMEDHQAPNYDDLPVWSPDSRWLLFEAFGQQDSRLFVVDTTPPTDNPRILNVVADTSGSDPSWSATGEIAIAEDGEIRIVRFDEAERAFEDVRRFTPDDSRSVSQLAWSPDGSRLVFNLSSASGGSLWTANADGSALAEIPNSTTGVYPAWSTDGSQIAFLRAGLFSPAETSHDLVIYNLASASITSEFAVHSAHEPLIGPHVWRPGEIVPEKDTDAQSTPTIAAAATATAESPTVVPTKPHVTSSALYIEPGSWFCSDTLRMEASGFPQDEPVSVAIRNRETGNSREVGIMPRANSDGEFTAELPISLMYPECEAEATRPDGLRLEISMSASGADGKAMEASVEIYVFADAGDELGVSLDYPRVQQAIQRVRDFLGDPEAVFTALPIEQSGKFTHVSLEQRDPNSPIPGGVINTFVVEVNHGAAFVANLAMNSAMAQPANSITADQARAVAEAFHAEHVTLDESLTVVDERGDIYLFGDEERYDITWQLQTEGVWLPTKVSITVSLKTGLVVGYMRLHYPYDGPPTPEISEQEAHLTAEQIIANDPELAGAAVGEARLEVWYSGPDDTIEGRSAADPEMDWRLAWTFTLTNRPSPDAPDVLLIDALTGTKLEPQM